MGLSAELFAKVLSALKATPDTHSRKRRNHLRVGLRTQVTIHPQLFDDTGTKPVDVWLRDLSRSGLGVLSSRPYAHGTLIIVELPRDHGIPVLVEYTVVQCREVSRGLFSIGLQLRRVLKTTHKPAA